ncbi:MAG: hypothetical protein ABI568_12160 [Pseudarthrobacter sp.]
MPEVVQRRLLRAALKAAGLNAGDLWLNYFSIGGAVGEYEVEAYEDVHDGQRAAKGKASGTCWFRTPFHARFLSGVLKMCSRKCFVSDGLLSRRIGTATSSGRAGAVSWA